MNPDRCYQLYSSLVNALLNCNQFKLKMVRYCQRKCPLNPEHYCRTVVAKPENIVLCCREDERMWVFNTDSDQLSVDLSEMPTEGKQSIVLLMEFCRLCAKREMTNGKVVIFDWEHILFFKQTFSERLKGDLEKIFTSIPPPLLENSNN